MIDNTNYLLRMVIWDDGRVDLLLYGDRDPEPSFITYIMLWNKWCINLPYYRMWLEDPHVQEIINDSVMQLLLEVLVGEGENGVLRV